MVGSNRTFNDDILDEKCRRIAAMALDAMGEAVSNKNYENAQLLADVVGSIGAMMSNLYPT